MKTLKAVLAEMILPFICCWFFMSVLVDIIAIPTVFKYISNMEEAGKIGMTVFHRFNCFEIFFGVFILLGLFSKSQKLKFLISIASFLFLLSLFYTFYMTPMITEASISLHSVAATDPAYEMIRSEHTTYHNLYRYFDTTKLFVLLFFAGMMIRLNIKEGKNV